MTYRIFKRAATSFEEFARAAKTTIDFVDTADEAREACAQFNDNRSQDQIRLGVKAEFERG